MNRANRHSSPALVTSQENASTSVPGAHAAPLVVSPVLRGANRLTYWPLANRTPSFDSSACVGVTAPADMRFSAGTYRPLPEVPQKE